MIRVFFDAYELQSGAGKSRGIYSYARLLFDQLDRQCPDGMQIVLACNGQTKDFCTTRSSGAEVHELSTSPPGKIRRLWWLTFGCYLALRRARCDIYLSPKGFLPFVPRWLGVRSVIVLHDLIPLWYVERFPAQFGLLEKMLVNSALRYGVKYASRVIAISQATADDVRLRLERTARVHVVHNGVPVAKSGPRPVSSKFIFAVASELPHKNGTNLLEAYQLYRQIAPMPLPMIVCGLAPRSVEGVSFVQNVTDEALHTFYAHAEFFVFLSLIEGFGFPPLEAMQHGTPVLCSDIPALREVGGPFAEYVEPEDIDAIAAKLVNFSEGLVWDRRALMAHAGSFTWQKCGRGVWDVINCCANS